MIYNLTASPSIFNDFISEIRDSQIQLDAMRFRKNLERMSEIMAYEVSKTLEFKTIEVTTPLGTSKIQTIREQPVIATVLRAGLATHQGFLNYFDKAESAFVSAYRKPINKLDFEIYEGYTTSPNLENKTLILSDPMLATGASMVKAYNSLIQFGIPKKLIICTIISTDKAIEFISRHLPDHFDLYTGAIDHELTAESYIVPGLGDAGDLAFGKKM